LIGEVFITITVSLQRTPQTFFLVLPIPEMKLMTGFRGTNLPTADLVMDEGFDEEQFFNPSGPAFILTHIQHAKMSYQSKIALKSIWMMF